MTKNSNTNQFIKQLAEREGISEEKVKEIIQKSFQKSYCQGENTEVDLHFEFDSGLLVYRIYKIVEKVNDPKKEITKKDELVKKGKVINNNFFLPLDTKNFSFFLNYEIKKQLRKDLGEISWERQYKSFKPLQGEIVKGNIQSIQENYYLVNLDKGIGHCEKKELILSDDKVRLGQNFYFLVKEVKEKVEKNMPQIILTHYDNLFIHKLLEKEIPELKEGIIVIHHILRIPGLLSKVLVESKNWNVDPLGTCIGKDAERIKAISRLVYPERVDIVAWSEDKKKLLFNLFSPIKVFSIIEKGNDWNIIISQDKISLLLQHGGKMLKEIEKYLGKGIHILTREEIEKEKDTIFIWNGNVQPPFEK